jgi:hypothetical protein
MIIEFLCPSLHLLVTFFFFFTTSQIYWPLGINMVESWVYSIKVFLIIILDIPLCTLCIKEKLLAIFTV